MRFSIEQFEDDMMPALAANVELEARIHAEWEAAHPKSKQFVPHGTDLPGNDDPPEWVEATTNKPDKLPAICDAADFVLIEKPAPPELIHGLLHQGTKMMIGGGSKSFKTWLQMDMAVSVASGKPWLGFPVEQGKVLFCNLELHEAFFHKRLLAICSARDIKLEKNTLDLWNLRGFSASYDVIIPEIIRRTKESAYALDFFDPIYKIYGKTDENSAGEVAKLVNSLENLCVQTQASVAFGAHFSKGNQSQKEAIDRTSGSGVWSRDPDSILTFTRHEEENCFTVEMILRNFPPIDPFVVRWEFPLMRRDDNLDPAKLKQISGRPKEFSEAELLGFIKDSSIKTPVSITQWAAAGNLPRQTLQDYLPGLRYRGYIATVGEGSSARQYLTEKGRNFLSV